jgi:hypothetical protein
MAKNTTTLSAIVGSKFPNNAHCSRTMQFEFNSMAGTPPNQVLDRTGERVGPPPSEKRQGP